MICTICHNEITSDLLKPYRLRSGEISYRKNCKTCYNKRNNQYPSNKTKLENRRIKRGSRIGVKYLELNTDDLIFIEKGSRFYYWLNRQGVIYVQYKCGFREVEKRVGSRGYLEFKVGRKNYNYKRVVAEKLVPNNCNGNFVFSKNGNILDVRPENLKWVWTRNNQNLTEQQAAERCTDERIKQAYLQGDKKTINRMINNHFEKIYNKLNPDLIGDLYLRLTEYAKRNLIFDLKSDSIQTYYGLKVQQKRNRLKTVQLNEKYI